MTIRRIKSYTGQTGLVWQYYFVGKRAALDPVRSGATEYVFDVTSDRRTTFAVSIFIGQEAVKCWGAHHGRALTETEQYAAAKMRLFQAFDEIRDLMGQGRELEVGKGEINSLLEPLDLG